MRGFSGNTGVAIELQHANAEVGRLKVCLETLVGGIWIVFPAPLQDISKFIYPLFV